jgi:tetratricopeptide (TPR) repeat protein
MEIRGVIRQVLFVVSLIFAFGGGMFEGIATEPYAHATGTVEQAKDLLDSWHGEHELLDKAKEILVQILAKDPQNYRALKEMARYCIMDGYLHSKNVANGGNIYTIGQFAPGTLQRAEAILKKALAINPSYAEGYVLLGHIYSQQSRFNQAREALVKAETLGTNDPWLHLNWAYVLNATGDTQGAADRYTRVLKSGTDNKKALSSAYGFLLEFHKKRREHDKVIELYQVLFKLDPTNAWSRGNYANYLRTELGRFDEAIAYAREALSIMNYGAGRHILALCLYGKWADVIINQKRPESEAQKYYDEAFRLDPELDLVMAYEGSYAKGKALVQLLKSKGVSVDAKAEDGSTALMIASNTGRIDAVRLLLSLGANPNVKSVNGWTALLGAADEGYEEVVKVLLESGADPKQTFRNADAATLAERRGRAEIARMIRQYAADKK